MKLKTGLDRNKGWSFGINVRDAFGMVVVELSVWKLTFWLEMLR